MILPVGIREVRIPDGRAAVQHVIPAHIQPHMGDALLPGNGPFKEDQVAGPRFLGRNGRASPVQAGHAQPTHVPDAAGRKDVADEPGAVKAGFRAVAAPYIGIADVLLRLLNQPAEGFILHNVRRDVVFARFAQRGDGSTFVQT